MGDVVSELLEDLNYGSWLVCPAIFHNIVVVLIQGCLIFILSASHVYDFSAPVCLTSSGIIYFLNYFLQNLYPGMTRMEYTIMAELYRLKCYLAANEVSMYLKERRES